jgi:hypothetical protein
VRDSVRSVTLRGKRDGGRDEAPSSSAKGARITCRKIIKTKGHFPNDDAATKLLFLALRNAEKKWRQAPKMWKSALNQFAIHFEGRLPA